MTFNYFYMEKCFIEDFGIVIKLEGKHECIFLQ